jgi:hypothetical protein
LELSALSLFHNAVQNELFRVTVLKEAREQGSPFCGFCAELRSEAGPGRDERGGWRSFTWRLHAVSNSKLGKSLSFFFPLYY